MKFYICCISVVLHNGFIHRICGRAWVSSEICLKVVSDLSDNTATITRTYSFPHTDESKAKISAANKGRVPWNNGKTHSEETKRRIAEKTKEAMLRRKEEKARALGMTVEEMDELRKEKQKEKKAGATKQGLTDEGRKRISDSLKARWENPGYRESYANATKGTRGHSKETRERISRAIRQKWQEGEYNNTSKVPSPEVRERISATLKEKWSNDDEFRQRMMTARAERPDDWREAISKSIRLKWENPEFREAMLNYTRNSTRVARARKPSVSIRPKLSPEEVMRRRELVKAEREEKTRLRKEAMVAAKEAAKAKKQQRNSQSLQQLLGREMWFEEKLRRKQRGEKFIDDAALEKKLLEEWGRDGEIEEEEEEEEVSLREDERRVFEYEEEDPEVIEVYGEDGELVGTYTVKEFERMRAAQRKR